MPSVFHERYCDVPTAVVSIPCCLLRPRFSCCYFLCAAGSTVDVPHFGGLESAIFVSNTSILVLGGLKQIKRIFKKITDI